MCTMKRAFLLFSLILLLTMASKASAGSSTSGISNLEINESSIEALEACTSTYGNETTGDVNGKIKCLQWYPDSPYASTEANTSLEQLKTVIPGCNFLQIKCEVTNETSDTATAVTNTSMLTDAISTARQFGYKVIMRVQMLRDARLFVPTNSDAWFASYGDAVEQYAIFAEDQGVEGLCFACEFSLLETPAYSLNWLNLISQFREVYSGNLWYEANYWANITGIVNSFEQKLNVTWFSELDCIAVSAYWELANATAPTVSDLVSSWHNYRGTRETITTPTKPWLVRDIVETLNNLSQTFNKKILIVSGIASAEGACMTPYRYGSAYDSVNLSLEEQENWYEALFQVFHDKSWVAGYEFDGAWSTTPNIPIKKDFFIQGKPAQEVVNTYFSYHPPITSFSYDPVKPAIDAEITFNASSTYDIDEDIATFIWDFDDGNISTTALSSITHSYSIPRVYNVTLTAVDMEGLNSSYTLPVYVRTETSVSLWTRTTSQVLNLTVEIGGVLIDTHSGGLENETVNLYVSQVGSDIWYHLSTLFTDDGGNYHAVWTPLFAGDFLIRTDYAESELHFGSSAIVALSILTYQSQRVFTIQSNSTISDLAFDAHAQKLIFDASGKAGTVSFTKITMDKSLIIDAAAITIHIDGESCNYALAELTDALELTFTLYHSTHHVEIDLHAAIPEFSFVFLPVLIFVFTAILTIAYRTQKKPAKRDRLV